jgi:hypothetical protein
MKTPACFVYADGTAVETEVEWRMPPGERAAYANGRESAARELHQVREALNDIEELIDGYIDIDHNGNPNLAMSISIILQALKERHECS